MPDVIDREYFSLENLIKTDLPPLPASVMRISALLSDMDKSQHAIADAISLDPVLSARILRLANSPNYALHGTVTNLLSAVSTVGNMAISDILVISGVNDAFGRKILNSPTGKEIWFHLLATGMASSEICRVANMRGADDAFSCGLLHDLGKLILLRADAPLYIKVMEQGAQEGSLTAVEQKIFGFDHAELGANAAVSWQLPAAVSHIIRFHHNPAGVTGGVAMANIVNIADKFVTLMALDKDLTDLLNYDPVASLGLTVNQFDSIWDAVSLRLSEVTDTFS
jgi:putative nucleotidyltransferase with HDIG domain